MVTRFQTAHASNIYNRSSMSIPIYTLRPTLWLERRDRYIFPLAAIDDGKTLTSWVNPNVICKHEMFDHNVRIEWYGQWYKAIMSVSSLAPIVGIILGS